MNLELPFMQADTSELDEYLARVDRDLDALFLDDVAGTLEQLRDDRAESDRRGLTAGAPPFP